MSTGQHDREILMVLKRLTDITCSNASATQIVHEFDEVTVDGDETVIVELPDEVKFHGAGLIHLADFTEVSGTPSYDVFFEGSIDGDNWFPVPAHNYVTDGYANQFNIDSFITGDRRYFAIYPLDIVYNTDGTFIERTGARPFRYFRLRFSGFAGGVSTSVWKFLYQPY